MTGGPVLLVGTQTGDTGGRALDLPLTRTCPVLRLGVQGRPGADHYGRHFGWPVPAIGSERLSVRVERTHPRGAAGFRRTASSAAMDGGS
jgi:hypothetical protein